MSISISMAMSMATPTSQSALQFSIPPSSTSTSIPNSNSNSNPISNSTSIPNNIKHSDTSPLQLSSTSTPPSASSDHQHFNSPSAIQNNSNHPFTPLNSSFDHSGSATHPQSTQHHQQQQQHHQQQQQQSETKRRRYRIPRSCDRCRTSKIKCVFENGRCAACVASAVPCTFANPGSLKERPPTQKDVEHLQARIRSLERLIHAVAPTLDLSNLPDPNSLQSFSSSSSLNTAHQPPFDHAPFEPPSELATNNNHQPTQLNPSSSNPGPVYSAPHWTQPGQQPSTGDYTGITFESKYYVGTNSVFSLPDPANQKALAFLPTALHKSEELSPVDKIIRNQYQQSVYANQHFYPEPDLERELLSLYFNHMHPFLAILHPPTFLQLHASGLAQTDASFRSLCLFVFALGSRFSSDPRVYLDLDGQTHPSLQIAGLRYAFSAGLYLYRPIATPATIYDLQAYVLMGVYFLGTVSPTLSWTIAGIGIQRAQEAGAHREHSNIWTANELRDHLRRKAFFALYELDTSLSATLGRAAYMQEEDFDLLPPDPEVTVKMRTFVNPFNDSGGVPKSLCEFHQAWSTMRSAIGRFRTLLPVLNSMNVKRDLPEGASLLGSVKALVSQIDVGMTRCFDQLSGGIKDCSVDGDQNDLLYSVKLMTWYHELRLLINRALFDYLLDKSSGGVNPYQATCVISATKILVEMNKLRTRKLLKYGFYWIPLRTTLAVIVLICSLKKQKDELGQEEIEPRTRAIENGIKILHDLAPSTFIAEKCANTVEELYKAAQVSTSSASPGTQRALLSLSGPTVGVGALGHGSFEPFIVAKSAFEFGGAGEYSDGVAQPFFQPFSFGVGGGGGPLGAGAGGIGVGVGMGVSVGVGGKQ